MSRDNFMRNFATIFFIVLFIAISYRNYFKEDLPTVFYCKESGRLFNMSFCSVIRIELSSVDSSFYDYLKTNCSLVMDYDCSGYEYYGYYSANYSDNYTFIGKLERYSGCTNCTLEYMKDKENFDYYESEYENPLGLFDKEKKEKRFVDWVLRR